jgi:phosphoglycolate phosphatase
LATGKSRRGVAALLARHGWEDLFDTVQTADDAPSKPHPGMIERALAQTGTPAGRAVMIGDSTYDMAMARAAGVRALGVSWGYHPPADLIAAGAQAVAADMAGALAWLGENGFLDRAR